MKDQTNAQQGSAEEKGEQTEKRGQRSYATYCRSDEAFDPMKDLNLPGSYDEVVTRFKRLQGERAMESLN